MKKLSIDLFEETGQDLKTTRIDYMPGDTIAGHLTFNTSSTIKYTCIKIRFVGLVSTKVAKTTEEVYVLNQQVVLLGNPNNAMESVLPEGKHSWPFEFLIPLQHIPSSGKYRHGTVKYTLTATISQKSFLGGMQDIKANHTVQLKDLVNCVQEPYSNRISVIGSSNTKPDTNKSKNLASATVQFARSAYLKGQLLQIAIDLAHPKNIQRDPGCWIQLIRKENYYAGENAKEYSHIVASSTQAIYMDSNNGTGKILAELTIPDNALPTMTTTKIISVQYRLVVLFDMRLRTGFMERKSRRVVSKKLRSKIISAPGGFEIEAPVVIGTLSDHQHRYRASPFAPNTFMALPGNTHGTVGLDANSPVMSIVGATSQLSLSTTSSGAVSPVLVRSSPLPSPGPGSPVLVETKNQTPSYTPQALPYRQGQPYVPQVPYRPNGTSGYNTLAVTYGRQTSEPNYHSLTRTGTGSGNRSRTLLSQPSSSTAAAAAAYKPLPSLPAIITHSQTQPSPQISTAVYASPDSAQPPPTHNILHSNMMTGPSGSGPTMGAGLGPNEYPVEKMQSPGQRHLHIHPPLSIQVPSPTAPQAVDLGMGPESPGTIYRRMSQRLTMHRASSSGALNGPGYGPGQGQGYFKFQPPPVASASGSIGRPAASTYSMYSTGALSSPSTTKRSPSLPTMQDPNPTPGSMDPRTMPRSQSGGPGRSAGAQYHRPQQGYQPTITSLHSSLSPHEAPSSQAPLPLQNPQQWEPSQPNRYSTLTQQTQSAPPYTPTA